MLSETKRNKRYSDVEDSIKELEEVRDSIKEESKTEPFMEFAETKVNEKSEKKVTGSSKDDTFMVVNVPRLRLRQEPYITATILDYLTEGTKLKIHSDFSDPTFVKVEIPGSPFSVGYVVKEFLTDIIG